MCKGNKITLIRFFQIGFIENDPWQKAKEQFADEIHENYNK